MSKAKHYGLRIRERPDYRRGLIPEIERHGSDTVVMTVAAENEDETWEALTNVILTKAEAHKLGSELQKLAIDLSLEERVRKLEQRLQYVERDLEEIE